MAFNHYFLNRDKAPRECLDSHWVNGPAFAVSYGGHEVVVEPFGSSSSRPRNLYKALGKKKNSANDELYYLLNTEFERLYNTSFPAGIDSNEISKFVVLAKEQLEKIDRLWMDAESRDPGNPQLSQEEVSKLKLYFDNAGQLLLCARYGEALGKALELYRATGPAPGYGPVEKDPRTSLQMGPRQSSGYGEGPFVGGSGPIVEDIEITNEDYEQPEQKKKSKAKKKSGGSGLLIAGAAVLGLLAFGGKK